MGLFALSARAYLCIIRYTNTIMAHHQADMRRMVPLVMAALFVAASLQAPSPASATVDECNSKCGEFEVSDPARFAACKDQCALEADFEVATRGLEECNKACEPLGPEETNKCMEACSLKVDSVVGVIETRACNRDCARTAAGGKEDCEARCKATKGAGGNKEVERLSAQLALKKKAAVPK
ncbi:hypothetical protein EJB05_25397 [Eragrostis curvula]|uniref:Uncharacterized protein n=1 Tax=Eragrostis curvula TaxID=38414 RepID=A0A5J9VBC1_9POAL|nr:hypothetical protein EJB05_25397 [Eragrostis curvula]